MGSLPNLQVHINKLPDFLLKLFSTKLDSPLTFQHLPILGSEHIYFSSYLIQILLNLFSHLNILADQFCHKFFVIFALLYLFITFLLVWLIAIDFNTLVIVDGERTVQK
jgi:hypothetical protein